MIIHVHVIVVVISPAIVIYVPPVLPEFVGVRPKNERILY